MNEDGDLNWNTPEAIEARTRSYNAELVRRYQAGLALTKEDRKLARRLIRDGHK